MEISEIQKRAMEILKEFDKCQIEKNGKKVWEVDDIAAGFVGDVGDLIKLLQAHKGIRVIEDHEAKLAHELSDCLWSILVLSSKLDIDIEKEFLNTMDDLETSLKGKLAS